MPKGLGYWFWPLEVLCSTLMGGRMARAAASAALRASKAWSVSTETRCRTCTAHQMVSHARFVYE